MFFLFYIAIFRCLHLRYHLFSDLQNTIVDIFKEKEIIENILYNKKKYFLNFYLSGHFLYYVLFSIVMTDLVNQFEITSITDKTVYIYVHTLFAPFLYKASRCCFLLKSYIDCCYARFAELNHVNKLGLYYNLL